MVSIALAVAIFRFSLINAFVIRCFHERASSFKALSTRAGPINERNKMNRTHTVIVIFDLIKNKTVEMIMKQ